MSAPSAHSSFAPGSVKLLACAEIIAGSAPTRSGSLLTVSFPDRFRNETISLHARLAFRASVIFLWHWSLSVAGDELVCRVLCSGCTVLYNSARHRRVSDWVQNIFSSHANLGASSILCVSFSPCSPAISTDGGNLRLTSQGDVVFEVGANGSVSFQSPGGAQMSLQGEKVRGSLA